MVRSKEGKNMFFGVTLKDLLDAGVLHVGEKLSYRGNIAELTYNGDIKDAVLQNTFASCSTWCVAHLHKDNPGSKAQVNGWSSTWVERKNEPEHKKLTWYREVYFAKTGAGPGPSEPSAKRPRLSSSSSSRRAPRPRFQDSSKSSSAVHVNVHEDILSNDGSSDTASPDIPSVGVAVHLPRAISTTQNLCLLCGSIGNDPGVFVHCSVCAESYHKFCCEAGRSSAKSTGHADDGRLPWRCVNCLVCEVCLQASPEENLLMCDMCDRGFHTTCCTPQIDDIPQGTWLCQDCYFCGMCGRSIYDCFPNAGWSEGKLLCNSCSKHLKLERRNCLREVNSNASSAVGGRSPRTNGRRLSRAASPRKRPVRATSESEPDDAIFVGAFDRDEDGVCPKQSDYDERICKLCGEKEENSSRLLFDSFSCFWIHANCLLWSAEVSIDEDGLLYNVAQAQNRGRRIKCAECGRSGATIGCYLDRCNKSFHFHCAQNANCGFFPNNVVYCSEHRRGANAKGITVDNAVTRPIFCNPVALNKLPLGYHLRIGNLVVFNLGRIVYDDDAFHTDSQLFTDGYEATRFFWSFVTHLRIVLYSLNIIRSEKGSIQFVAKASDAPEMEVTADTAEGCWSVILEKINKLRRCNKMLDIRLHKDYALQFFGLNLASVMCCLESLPNAAFCRRYRFRWIDETNAKKEREEGPVEERDGCARCEERRVAILEPEAIDNVNGHTDQTTKEPLPLFWPGCVDIKLNDLREMPLSNMYKSMMQNYRKGVEVGASKIHSKGLFTRRRYEAHEMVIEYIGEIVGQQVADVRDARYEKARMGMYMFRLDYDRIIDATLAGNEARFINHSCAPNCCAKIIIVEGTKHVVIFTGRTLEDGEEITYDYKMDFAVEEGDSEGTSDPEAVQQWGTGSSSSSSSSSSSKGRIEACRCGSIYCRGLMS